jgi:hypothetical protein
VAATVLGRLSGYGVVGLGLIAGEPRQILSRQPPFTQPQLAAQRIRIVDNPQSAALVTALGAHPIQGLASNAVNGRHPDRRRPARRPDPHQRRGSPDARSLTVRLERYA